MIVELGLMLAGMLMVGFLAQWLAWRVKLPAILFLLLAGIVLGPVSGVLNPDVLLGDLLFPMVSLAVALILFEGSLTLRFHELPGIGRAVRCCCWRVPHTWLPEWLGRSPCCMAHWVA